MSGFRVKMRHNKHYNIAKNRTAFSGFTRILCISHARFHCKNERNQEHSFYDLVHSFLKRCWFISQDVQLFREIFALFASYSVIIFN